MIAKPVKYSAAWVPYDERSWDQASALAGEWIEDEAQRLSLPVVLLTNTFSGQADSGPLADLVRRGAIHTTRRSRSVSSGTGPVFAYVPHVRELAYSIQLARNTALCVVETPSFPVRGWASAVGAVDLLTGEITPPPAAELKDELDHLVFNGNNGYGDVYGKRDAKRSLGKLSASADYDPDFIVGYLAGSGISENGLTNIQKLIGKL
ncbi:hypothetical protein FOS14_18135 [Skermania sp. ID1734]|uniref:hypothetical protein n=1 Tax=Skermania sp. ID1734 TaxID=2597516 RepID=UPI00117FA4B1|nr:hypothetical protein [Skermania sp. ID1734]TSD95285.1 hypothetical protein FOS14_18135 [Skermania sp. ID1734]